MIIHLQCAAGSSAQQSAVTLTPREAQVLELAHLHTKDIAVLLGISQSTVRTLLGRAFLRLGAETRTQAALAWRDRRAA